MTCKNSSNYLTDNSSCSGKSWFAFFYGLGLACGLIVSSWWLAQKLLTPTAVSASPLTGADSVPLNALHMSGSWGRLRVETIYTEKPAHFIDVAPYLKSEEKWFFEEMDIAEIREWLTINGFDKDFVEELVIAEPKPDVKGVYLHPTQKLIIQLDPQERKKIHNLLAKNSINHFSENPFLFTPDVIQQIRSNPIIQEEGSGAIFEKLLYPRGTAMCLSDISCLLSNVKNPSLCAAWLKLLTRTKTILLKLEIDKSSDIDSLVNYWSGPFNLKDFQPLLESLKVDNQTSRLDVIHLLPPVARQIIYTYPIEDGVGEYRDCHWTVINFFEESKNDQFLDPQKIVQEIEANYVNVDKPEKFGDILMFTPDNNSVIHSCVYIAADMVFTKNGMGAHQPWTISTLQEVTSIYGNMKILVKRRKSSTS